MIQEKYRVLPGPEGFVATTAALMGVVLPDEGGAFVEGGIVPEGDALGLIAEKLANAKKPAICPGPLLMWQWNDSVPPKAAAVRKLAEACGAKIYPMPDYRAKSPRINPEIEISVNHPNITILHNDIDVCVFVGVHSHYANFALRLIRGGTGCYTICLNDYAASDEAMISLRDVDAAKIKAITEKIKK
jgi:hypothetical protein